MSVRGFLSGVIWGSAVAVLGLGVVSQMAPQPGVDVRAAGPDVPLASAPTAPAIAPTQTPAPAPTPIPAIIVDPLAAPAPAGEPAVEIATSPTAPMATFSPEPDKPVPPALAPDGGVEVPQTQVPTVDMAEPPVLANAPSVAAMADLSPPAPSPMQDHTATTSFGTAPAAPAAQAAPVADTESTAIPEVLALGPAGLAKPDASAPAPSARIASPLAPADALPAATDPARPTAPADDPRPAGAELPPPPPLTDAELALLQPLPETQPDANAAAATPAPIVEPEVASPEPVEPEPGIADDQSILRPVPGLADAAAGVTTDRLPRIGDAPAPEATAPVADLPAMVRFARPFANPSARPLFGLILIDTGGPDVDRSSLAALPFPVSFAIDPTAPDAATAAAIYRAAGQEVLMLASGIPQGATAADLEVTFQAHAAALPEAVAVLDLENGGFQNDRPLATQVVPILKAQGRGLLTWDKGLNAGDQVARRDGLAAALIYRRLDAGDETAPTLKRYLDRAAFKAAQDGRVAVVGQTRPETVKAILEWTVEGRVAALALAPVTALLTTP
ncbi:MAG: divergent polysaccharide deacetylase family protein [Pseudorhodobacter sp.]|nr:divergent polysaccharide deacetylase family protein [Pseudorhodobacter sp.]